MAGAAPGALEFFGDEIESLREFDLDTQTAVRNLQAVDVLLGAAEDQGGIVRDYIAKDHLQVAIEPEEQSADANISDQRGLDRRRRNGRLRRGVSGCGGR